MVMESLKEHGVTYKEVALKDGMIDVETVLKFQKQRKLLLFNVQRVWTTTFNYSR